MCIIYVIIQKIESNNNINDEISENDAYRYIKQLYDTSKITSRESSIMQNAVSDMALYRAENKNRVRADILKSMMQLMKEEL